MAPPENVADLLTRAVNGDSQAAEAILPQIYEALHGLARRYMAREPVGHTLQTTALVNEAYLRLVGNDQQDWNSRGHFYGAAAQAMRRILVERARKYKREKHGGNRKRISLEDAEIATNGDSVDYLALDEALTKLQAQDARAAEIVMLRYFAGLTVGDVAHVLDVSDRTVRREWNYARLWLYEQMSEEGTQDESNDA